MGPPGSAGLWQPQGRDHRGLLSGAEFCEAAASCFDPRSCAAGLALTQRRLQKNRDTEDLPALVFLQGPTRPLLLRVRLTTPSADAGSAAVRGTRIPGWSSSVRQQRVLIPSPEIKRTKKTNRNDGTQARTGRCDGTELWLSARRTLKRGVGGFEKGGIDTTRWMKRALEEYRVFLLDQCLNPVLRCGVDSAALFLLGTGLLSFGAVLLDSAMTWYKSTRFQGSTSLRCSTSPTHHHLNALCLSTSAALAAQRPSPTRLWLPSPPLKLRSISLNPKLETYTVKSEP
eukprot:2439908-Rhodomonas_salina.2